MSKLNSLSSTRQLPSFLEQIKNALALSSAKFYSEQNIGISNLADNLGVESTAADKMVNRPETSEDVLSIAETKPCTQCEQLIPARAKVCFVCQNAQSSWRRYSLQKLPIVISIVALLISAIGFAINSVDDIKRVLWGHTPELVGWSMWTPGRVATSDDRTSQFNEEGSEELIATVELINLGLAPALINKLACDFEVEVSGQFDAADGKSKALFTYNGTIILVTKDISSVGAGQTRLFEFFDAKMNGSADKTRIPIDSIPEKLTALTMSSQCSIHYFALTTSSEKSGSSPDLIKSKIGFRETPPTSLYRTIQKRVLEKIQLGSKHRE